MKDGIKTDAESTGDEIRERITVDKDEKIDIPNTKNATCNFIVKF